MGTATVEPPKGFILDAPAPPPGFVLDGATPPPGFVLDSPVAGYEDAPNDIIEGRLPTTPTMTMAGAKPVGMTEQGNINLMDRPDVANPDGTHSSVRTISVGIDDQEVLIPTVSEDGRIMSDDEAIQQYRKTGRHLGKFTSPDEATAYADILHKQQEGLGKQPGAGSSWSEEIDRALARGGLRTVASGPGTLGAIGQKIARSPLTRMIYPRAAQAKDLPALEKGARSLQDTAKLIYDEAQMETLRPQKKGAWGYVANTTFETLPMMAAATAAGAATGGAGAFAVGAMTEGEAAYQEAKKGGAPEDVAQTERLIVGTINGVIERMQADEILKLGKGISREAISAIKSAAKERALGKLAKTTGKVGLAQVGKAVNEGLEEALQETVSIGAATMHGDTIELSQDVPRVGQAALGGAVAGGILGLGGSIAQTALEAEPTTEPPATPQTDIAKTPPPEIGTGGQGFTPTVQPPIEQTPIIQETEDATRIRADERQVPEPRAVEESGAGESRADLQRQAPEPPGRQTPVQAEEVTPPPGFVSDSPIDKAERQALQAQGYSISEIVKMSPAEARSKLTSEPTRAETPPEIAPTAENVQAQNQPGQTTAKSGTMPGVTDEKGVGREQQPPNPERPGETLPQGFEVFDRGAVYRDTYGREKPVKPHKRYGIVTDKGIDTRVYAASPAKVIAEYHRLVNKPAPDTRPDYLRRVDLGEGSDEDIQAVASDYLAEQFGWPSRSAKSEAEYFTLDDDRRIRLARHDVVYAESDVEMVISIGQSNDADVEIPSGATAQEIKTIIDNAISSFNPSAGQEAPGTQFPQADAALAKPSATPPAARNKGIMDVSVVRKAYEAVIGTLEPARPVVVKHGRTATAEVIKAAHHAEAKTLEFDEKALETVEQSVAEFEKELLKYTSRDLEDVMLTRGHGLEGDARTLQIQAFARLPKALKEPKIRRALDEIAKFNYRYLQSVAGDDINQVEDYFYGIYKGGRKVSEFLKHWRTTDNYTKKKVFPTYADAKAFGLEARTVNPVENLRKEFQAIARREAMKQLHDTMMEQGRGVYIQEATSAPVNWEYIGDPLRPEPSFAKVRVEPTMAKLINSLISTNKITQNKMLDSFRKVNNAWRSFKFIGSAFHAWQIAKQSIADTGYLGFYKATSRTGLKSVFTNMTKDPALREAYQDYVAHGGGHKYSIESEAQRALRDMMLQLDATSRVVLKGIAAPAKIPLGFVNWMFEQFIPSVKFGKYMDAIGQSEAKLGRAMTSAEKIETIKELQNFYGMMNERLFGRSGTVTTALRFVFMAPGYAEGNARTMIKAATQWGAGADGYKASRSRANIVNSWVLTATLATAGTLILTGKPPKEPESLEEVRDLLKIDTGKKDQYGDRIMIDLASYDKDYWDVYFNVFRGRPDVAIAKSFKRLGGMKAASFELVHDLESLALGKAIYDWKEDRVYHPTDPFVQKMAKLLMHEVRRLEPISVSVFNQTRSKDVDTSMAIMESLLGLRTTYDEAALGKRAAMRDCWDLRSKREELAWKLAKYKDPWAGVAYYNSQVTELLSSKFVPQQMRNEWSRKLLIDPKKVIEWKHFPPHAMTVPQIQSALAAKTYAAAYRRDDGTLARPGTAHKGSEERVAALEAELTKRKVPRERWRREQVAARNRRRLEARRERAGNDDAEALSAALAGLD